MLSGVIVAAAIAAAVERSILGQHPVFEVQRAYTLVLPVHSSRMPCSACFLRFVLPSPLRILSLPSEADSSSRSGSPNGLIHAGRARHGTLAVLAITLIKQNGSRAQDTALSPWH